MKMIIDKLKKSGFIRVMSFMKPRMFKYAAGMIGMSLLFSALSLVESFALKHVIETAEVNDMTLMLRGVILAVILYLGITLLIPVARFYYNQCSQLAVLDVKSAIFKHRSRLPISYFENTHSGDILSRLDSDASLMCELYASRIRRLIFPIIYGVTAAIPMFILNWKLSLALMILNLACAVINFKYIHPMREVSDRIQRSSSLMTQRLLDLFAGFQIMRAFGIEEYILKKYMYVNDEMTSNYIRRVKLGSGLDAVNYAAGIISTLGVIIAGSYLVTAGLATFGTLFAIINLQGRLNRSFLEVANYIPQVQKMMAGSSRVFELLDTATEPQREDKVVVKDQKAAVKLDEVVFSYDKENIVLNGLSLEVQKNQTAALVGPSGQGKSTVIKLLLGFYPHKSGMITINGIPIEDYSLRSLREMISYVPQDPFLYNVSIRENIRYGRISASDEEIEQAAKDAYVHEFITRQPEGYDTVVGERGVKLSGGQMQRIAIARAMLKNSPILLLDEATSSLDSESEEMVQKALERLRENRTTIVIAHRLSTIEHADMICVVQEGKITEKGSHLQLIKDNGLYRKLYETQFH